MSRILLFALCYAVVYFGDLLVYIYVPGFSQHPPESTKSLLLAFIILWSLEERK